MKIQCAPFPFEPYHNPQCTNLDRGASRLARGSSNEPQRRGVARSPAISNRLSRQLRSASADAGTTVPAAVVGMAQALAVGSEEVRREEGLAEGEEGNDGGEASEKVREKKVVKVNDEELVKVVEANDEGSEKKVIEVNDVGLEKKVVEANDEGLERDGEAVRQRETEEETKEETKEDEKSVAPVETTAAIDVLESVHPLEERQVDPSVGVIDQVDEPLELVAGEASSPFAQSSKQIVESSSALAPEPQQSVESAPHSPTTPPPIDTTPRKRESLPLPSAASVTTPVSASTLNTVSSDPGGSATSKSPNSSFRALVRALNPRRRKAEERSSNMSIGSATDLLQSGVSTRPPSKHTDTPSASTTSLTQQVQSIVPPVPSDTRAPSRHATSASMSSASTQTSSLQRTPSKHGVSASISSIPQWNPSETPVPTHSKSTEKVPRRSSQSAPTTTDTTAGSSTVTAPQPIPQRQQSSDVFTSRRDTVSPLAAYTGQSPSPQPIPTSGRPSSLPVISPYISPPSSPPASPPGSPPKKHLDKDSKAKSRNSLVRMFSGGGSSKQALSIATVTENAFEAPTPTASMSSPTLKSPRSEELLTPVREIEEKEDKNTEGKPQSFWGKK